MCLHLNDLKTNEKGVVIKVTPDNNMQRRFLDIGLVKNTVVECVGKSPFGDPGAYLIRGAVIAIRNSDCKDVYVEKISEVLYG